MNQVVLPFAAMSKSHGYLRLESGAWQLGDIGSKNGSFVDGQRLAMELCVALRDGASLRFGDVTAKFWLPPTFITALRRRVAGTG